MKHIIVVGNPVDGYEFYGPFDTSDDALRFHDSELDYGDHWEITQLKSPEPNMWSKDNA